MIVRASGHESQDALDVIRAARADCRTLLKLPFVDFATVVARDKRFHSFYSSFWEGRSRPYDYLSGAVADAGSPRVRGGLQYCKLSVDLERRMILVACRLLAGEAL